MGLAVGHHFDSGRGLNFRVLFADQDLQGERGILFDFLVFLKDMGPYLASGAIYFLTGACVVASLQLAQSVFFPSCATRR